MGIFDSIKKGFNNAVSWVKNTWNLNEKFTPYFNKREKFSTLRKITKLFQSTLLQEERLLERSILQ